MLSLGIEASLAFWTARPSAGLPSGSPPPSFAATVIARASLVKSLPRRASTIAFLCLIPAHLECPAMARDSMSAGASAPRAVDPLGPRGRLPAVEGVEHGRGRRLDDDHVAVLRADEALLDGMVEERPQRRPVAAGVQEADGLRVD